MKKQRRRRLSGRVRGFVRQHPRAVGVAVVALVALTLTSRICVAYFLGNDEPGDGVVYARMARNMLEQGVFSVEEQAPFLPTLIRMPGYPLFLAGIYSIFGHDNNTAVRIVQAVMDTLTCVILAVIGWVWTEDRRRKRANAFWTFLLAALCPFIVIYAGLILSETLATFLLAAMTLTASLALKNERLGRSLFWWAATGLIAGISVFVRPDSGLFAAGIGVTLVVSELCLRTSEGRGFWARVGGPAWRGAGFSLVFCLVLTPWAVRNYRVFGVFQPISPAHGEMPGEFVQTGYFRWLRTWVDDFRFIDPMQWSLDEKRIDVAGVPRQDFDSPEERDRVAALLWQYNHPPGSEAGDEQTDDNSADGVNEEQGDESPDAGDEEGDNADDSSADESSGTDESDDENKKDVVAMTPEIDAGFAQIADERIERAPWRYYLFLPVKRAAALWFDSHSLYYPFGGQLSPVSELDYDVSQQYWLPLFVALMWIYTLLATGGVIYFWRERSNTKMLRWLVLLALMTLPRVVFFSTVENPEPRYLVELFAFTALLAGSFIANHRRKRRTKERPGLPGDRLVYLDAFRGLTIAAMVLVNEPGLWSAVYPPLKHAEWNGATATDWIFPFFLFIVGVSIVFAFSKYHQATGKSVYAKIVKRASVLFALGLLLEAFPFYNIWTGEWIDPGTTRIMGVLQRIAICYVASSLVYLKTNWKTQTTMVAVLLLGYWSLMTLVPVPGCDVVTFDDKTCNLVSYIDRLVLGQGHIWNQSSVIDPEGILSTLPAIATTLVGVLVGTWLKSSRDSSRKVARILVCGLVVSCAGWLWSGSFPLNKSLWTSSYVLYTAGLAMVFLAAFYWLIDLKGYKKWAMPFVVFGTNAIALYIGSTIVGKTLDIVELAAPHDATITLQEKIYTAWFAPLASPMNASLLYSIAFVLLWLCLMWLLYRKRIFLRI